MKKKLLIKLLIPLFTILFCCCSKTKPVNNTAEEIKEAIEDETSVSQNFERDYFLCPYWFEYIENNYQTLLYLDRNFNKREKTKRLSVYTYNNDNKRLEERLYYDKGLLTKWESFSSKGDDSTFIYVYDERGRLITRYDINESGAIVDSCNYSYSYENGKLICNSTGSIYGDIMYTEDIVDNSFHIKRIINDAVDDYYIELNKDVLRKFCFNFSIGSSEYKNEYFFTYNGNNILVKIYANDELNRQQEWNRNGDIVNFYLYYGENLETGEIVRKDIFKDFDKYDNWLTMIEDDGTTYIREFEYIE